MQKSGPPQKKTGKKVANRTYYFWGCNHTQSWQCKRACAWICTVAKVHLSRHPFPPCRREEFTASMYTHSSNPSPARNTSKALQVLARG